MYIDDTRAMQTVGQIASHNTYTTSNWVSHLDNVNAVELDVWPQFNWRVAHTADILGGHLLITKTDPYTGYMPDLANWISDWNKANLGESHDLITVFLEMKDDVGWRIDDFEKILVTSLPYRSMFRPIDLVIWGNSKGYQGRSLKDLVKNHGWPTFKEVRGKVMFVLNGDAVLDTYLAERPVVWNNEWSRRNTPTCFVMPNFFDERATRHDVVISNGEYDAWPLEPTQPEDKCLRRASRVRTGNDEMANDNNKTEAEKNMIQKKINYLCYDYTENAFSVNFP